MLFSIGEEVLPKRKFLFEKVLTENLLWGFFRIFAENKNMKGMIESVNKRRTIRKYSGETVSDEVLNRLLEAAGHTQTMGNLQLYSVVVTRSEEMKMRLSPFHFNQPMVKQAPVVLTVCADFNRTTKWAECRKAHPGYDNFLSFMNAVTDALLFTQTFCNLAEAEGLGVCYLGTTLYMPSQIVEALRLPKLVMPVATLTVGYPDECPAQADRLPLASFVHEEVYRDYSAEDIDCHYLPKEELPENKHFVEINRKETLAQVFTDLRYTKKDNEIMSQDFLDALRHQGFLD